MAKKVTHYLAMWDMKGLECLFNVNLFRDDHIEWEKKKIWKTLKEEEFKEAAPSLPLNMMILRARMNSQRSYEIYEFNSTMTEGEIREVFDTDPQLIVDWIRENGYKIYSNYVKSERKLIA